MGQAASSKPGFSWDPRLVLPGLGFGLFLFIADNVNAPVLLVTNADAPDGSRLPTSLISFALTIAFLWFATRKPAGAKWRPSLVTLSAVLVTLYYFAAFALSSELLAHPIALHALETISFIARAALFYFWVVALLPLGSRRCAAVFALALVVFAVTSILSILEKELAAQAFLSIVPCVSAALLQVFHMRLQAKPDVSRDEIYLQAQECLKGNDNVFLYVTGVLAPCLCGSGILAIIHQIWTHTDAQVGQTLGAQGGLIIGALVMATLTYGLLKHFWTYINLQVTSVFIPLLLVAMLWISLSEPTWVPVYFSLMLVAQKCLCVLCLTAPFMFRVGKSPLTAWCVAYVVFQFGGFVGSSLLEGLSANGLKAALVVIVAVLAFAEFMAFLLHGLRITQANEGYSSGSFRNEGKYRTAIKSLAESSGLTSREQDILVELGRGRNAQYVAERLVTSPQTVKTHQKSIYSKLNVHSQQELIALVDQTISEPGERR